MQKIYTKKQILEALQWWKAQLKLVSESKENVDDFDTQVQSDELDDGSYEESLKLMSREEVDSKADAELKKQASALGLADGEVVGLLLGKLCIINTNTNEIKALTSEQYRKYCEMNNTCKPTNESKNKGCKSSDRIGVDCDRPKPVTPSGGGSSGGNIISANGFTFPVSGGHISQSYGNRGHKGVDIGKGCGAPIKAVAAGRVYYVGNTLDNYGAKMVIIVHNVNGRLVFSQYAHLSGYAVSSGQDVSVGQTIGYMGNTGYSFGCHLHLEMSEDYGWNYNSSYYTYIKHIINPFKYVPY